MWVAHVFIGASIIPCFVLCGYLLYGSSTSIPTSNIFLHLYIISYTAKTELGIVILNIFMVTSVASFIEKITIVLCSSTRHERLCGISTKELLQCVFLIIYGMSYV